MLDPGDFGQHLFRGYTHHLLDLIGGCTGKRNKNIGESDIDLRLFFTRGYHYRKDTQQ